MAHCVKGLRIRRSKGNVGSSPTSGTRTRVAPVRDRGSNQFVASRVMGRYHGRRSMRYWNRLGRSVVALGLVLPLLAMSAQRAEGRPADTVPAAPAGQAVNGRAPSLSLARLLAVDDPPPSSGNDGIVPADRNASTDTASEDRPVAKVTYVDEVPVYKKWWFWALTAAVIGGTVALGVWAADPSDTPARPCSAGTRVCFGDGR